MLEVEGSVYFPFRMYPNPVREWSYVEWDSKEELKAEVYGIGGRLRGCYKVGGGKGEIDMRGYSGDMYLVVLRDREGVYKGSGRVVVVK